MKKQACQSDGLSFPAYTASLALAMRRPLSVVVSVGSTPMKPAAARRRGDKRTVPLWRPSVPGRRA